MLFREEMFSKTTKMPKRKLTTKLILPHQPYNDDFLIFISSLMKWVRWWGIAGGRGRLWKAWGAFILLNLLFINVIGAWRVIKALSGSAMLNYGNKSVTYRLSGLFFYTSAIMSQILSWRFCSSWHDLSTFWSSVERSMAIHVPPEPGLRRRLIFVTVTMLVCSLVEHVMSVMSSIGLETPPSEYMRKYVMASHAYLLLNHYTIYTALLLIMISNIATFLWNFVDVLVVLMSVGLASRYHRLNVHLAQQKKLAKNFDKLSEATWIHNWRRIREAYNRQAALVRKVDKSVGGLIFLSNLSNLYFICLQLFLGITKGITGSFINRLYYLVSLLWLCTRVACVVMAAADINVHSKRALRFLHGYHARFFNVEMDRLQNQLSRDYIALSGMGFFTLNRTVLLQMASAIVTYELVLIQFDNKGEEADATLRGSFTNSTVE